MIIALELTLSSSRLKKSTNVGNLFSPIKIPLGSKIALLTKGKVDAMIEELRPREILVLLYVLMISTFFIQFLVVYFS